MVDWLQSRNSIVEEKLPNPWHPGAEREKEGRRRKKDTTEVTLSDPTSIEALLANSTLSQELMGGPVHC